MSNYRIRTRSHTHPRLGGEGISAEAIGWLIPDAVLVELTAEGTAVIIELRLERPTHLEALNEIFAALQRLGYSVIESTVSEWVDAAVETALAGALSLGGGAQAKTKDARIALAAALAGAIAGHWAGSRLGRLEVVYELVPTPGGWVLTPTANGGAGPAPLVQN